MPQFSLDLLSGWDCCEAGSLAFLTAQLDMIICYINAVDVLLN